LRMVRLLHSRITPVFGCRVSSVRRNAESILRVTVVSVDGDLSNSVLDGCRRFVCESNLQYI
jgi:hypothetical protein